MRWTRRHTVEVVSVVLVMAIGLVIALLLKLGQGG
jgi:hypothetical protein